MTWDHVPPKGVLFQHDVFANTVFAGMPTESNHMKRYQSGIKYRTLCGECNNVVLGKYDKDYKAFVETVNAELTKAAESGAVGSIKVITKINRVLRAISGHFLAMKIKYDDVVLVDKFLREYVFDETRAFTDYKVYSWLYPYLYSCQKYLFP